MCYHSLQRKEAKQLEHRYKAKIKEPALFMVQESYNGFTFPRTPVIANTDSGIIEHFQWGLIPSWANDNTIRAYTLNAKIETINEKPAFKASVNNRCLIIADGFFEWQWLDPKGRKKQKYLITMQKDELFSFGGIWSEWVNKITGEIIRSYSIVTTEANEMMAVIHNTKKRMPVILEPGEEKEWLAGASFNLFKKRNVDLIAVAV